MSYREAILKGKKYILDKDIKKAQKIARLATVQMIPLIFQTRDFIQLSSVLHFLLLRPP